jgi:hypothetical protein
MSLAAGQFGKTTSELEICSSEATFVNEFVVDCVSKPRKTVPIIKKICFEKCYQRKHKNTAKSTSKSTMFNDAVELIMLEQSSPVSKEHLFSL